MGRPKKRQRAENGGDEECLDEGPNDGIRNPGSVLQHGTSQSSTFADAVSHPTNTIHDVDPSTFDSTFALDGMLHPWAVSNLDWSVPGVEGQALDNSVPGLTRDNSSENSPPAFNVPTDFQHTLPGMPQTEQGQLNHTSHGISAAYQAPTCACLSTLYLTLSNLATMDPAFSFPTALHPLREAMSIASQVMVCQACPASFITGLQNVQLLNALLMSLAERFSRVLNSISAEAAALEQHNATASPSEQKSKSFRMADLSTPGHLHTGGTNCAAAFSLSFTPTEWRSMAKKVVRAEVHGPADGKECCPYLLGLIGTMEQRQDRWHKAPPPTDFPRDKDGAPIPRVLPSNVHSGSHAGEGTHGQEQGEHLCLKMLAGTRLMIDGFDWD